MMPPRWMQTPARGRERTMEGKEGMLTNLGRKLLATLVLFVATFSAHAQTQFPLGSNGWMGLGNRNGDFFIEQDDLSVKVPGGYVRINRDYDGKQWVFNRQWSGLGRPSYNKAMYPSMGAFFSCTVVDGVSSCDNTASSGSAIAIGNPENEVQQTRIPNDPFFGRDLEGRPVPDPHAAEFVARNGVGFSRSTDGTSWVSSKHPRFVVRPQSVPVLPTSNGADAHPAPGKPGAGGTPTTLVNGFRWIDRSGSWIEYDNIGRITSYGDRNNVRVWFQYGSHGQVERILDDNGRTVFTLLYSNGSADFITEVRDHTPLDGSIRRVSYQYDGDGRLRNVVDARGNTTSFDYGSLDSPAYDYNGSFGAPDSGGSGAPIGARASSAAMLLVDTRRKVTKVTDAEGRVTEIGYGVTARVGRVKAPDGGLTEFDYGYDKLKKEFSVTVRHPKTEGGQRIDTLRFDQEGRPVRRETNGKTVMSAAGDGRSMTYLDERNGSTTVLRDNFDEITKITYADGTTRSYAYEAGSTDVREYIDEAGTRWQYRWDGRGNLLDYRAAAGLPEELVTEQIHNARGEVEVLRRKGGENQDGSVDNDIEIRMVRDSNGNVVETLDGEGKRWTYSYDSLGNMTEEKNPLGHTWTYSYDASGNLLIETDPNAHTTTYTYDRTDRALTVTDGRGKTTRFGYDAAGRDASITNAYGQTSVDVYDVTGRLASRMDATGRRATMAYDDFGRLTRVQNGDSLQTLLEYRDGDGVDRGGRQPGRVVYPSFERQLRYDARKRPVMQTELFSGDTSTTSVAYSAYGQIKALTDANGHTQTYERDALGRTVAAVNQLGDTVRLGYGHNGQLTSVTDAKGHVTRMTHDGRGLQTSETNAAGQTTHFAYDAAGNLAEVRRPNGASIRFEYDAADRPQRGMSYRPDGTLESTQEFSWDESDNLIGWTTDRASSTLTYDDADRLITENVTVDGVTLSRAYTYYPNDQLRTYTGPDGVQVTYTYDHAGRLERVDIPDEGAISATEWTWMAARKVVFPGGTVQEIDRDGLMHMTRMRVKSPAQVTLFELAHRFGKMRELLDRDVGGKTTRFEYDEAVRLIKADAQYSGGASEIFVIDKAGNREQHSVVPGDWQYDEANRLQRRGDVTYDYDGAGNIIRKVDQRLAEPLRTTRYAYDAFNRMVEVRDGAGAVVASYAYDPFDNRIVKDVKISRGGAPVGKTLYLHGSQGLLAEVAGDGEVVRTYGWHPEGTYATHPIYQRANLEYFYYHNDHLGTPWRVTNKAGEVVWAADDYTAFGTARVAGGARISQPWRLPGQYLDAETGLHYNLRRYYEPETGRYTTEDPLGFESATNFYTYVDHSPTNFTDPTGEIAPAAWWAANIARQGAQWAARRYMSCLAECALVDGALDLIRNPCNVDVSDCLKECLWSLVPIPVRCGKVFGTMMGGLTGFLSSFTGDTLVATPDGHARIEDLRPGDKVLAFAEWTGKAQVEEVTELILSKRKQTLVHLTLGSGSTLDVTGGHPLSTPSGWVAAQLLQAGDKIHVKGEDGGLAVAIVAAAEHRDEVIPVYNLGVSNAHTFFVGLDDVLAHNAIHHLCTNKNKDWSDKFRDLFDKYGLGRFKNGRRRKDVLNDPLNKVDVPGHQGPHNPDMHAQTYDRLDNAGRNGGADGFRDELQRIRSETLTPGTPLNDSATGKRR